MKRECNNECQMVGGDVSGEAREGYLEYQTMTSWNYLKRECNNAYQMVVEGCK